MHTIGLIVYMMNVLLNTHVIGYTFYVNESNSLYMQCFIFHHYDDISSIDLYVVLRYA